MRPLLGVIDVPRRDKCARVLVAGNTWLLNGLAGELPDATLHPDGGHPYDALVGERGCLHLVSDDQLKQIDRFVLVDPEDRERLRLTAIKAGRPGARITVLPSLAAIGAAEHAMLLILALTRRLLSDYSAVVGGGWTRQAPGPALRGKTLGIIGFGRSGQALAERAMRFGTRVLFHDTTDKGEAQARLSVTQRRFDQILREADVISLHLPVTSATQRLIDAPELASMKSTAVLINVADGRLIDEGSLIKALRSGDIAGAGLDSFAYQPLAPDSPLIRLENVVLTPGTAWMSEADERTSWLAEIIKYLAAET